MMRFLPGTVIASQKGDVLYLALEDNKRRLRGKMASRPTVSD
jgi:hypothetical protein